MTKDNKNSNAFLEKYSELTKPLNRRGAKRHPWKNYTGVAMLTDDQREFKFQPVDVSETGMCILSKELLARGDMLLFIYKKVSARLEVAWVRSEDECGMFRYGLTRVNPNQKLDEIFLS